ncbi:acetyl-coenzyme A transporter 1 [Crepidotus variabilis]|uniref:Acetyl-coenzyme A transporter 1 n=1 Tax=Crepidotus variabilis TaxID=179855 RepID=A0A9P6EUH0_9AGAR|nr:acetyl-coenzyme A transporter 1 [Crepidotus variabilis]
MQGRNGSPKPMAVSSSLNSIQITPRTPKTPRPPMYSDDDDVELSLLNEEERVQSARDRDEEESVTDSESDLKKPISAKDKRMMALLCVLYLLQGIPLGLALGSVPFLLKEHLSYSQLATFSLSSYPYSLKLLWSPIVDAVFFKAFGRRKSWIVPMQLIVGSLMLYISLNVERLMEDPAHNIIELTAVFLGLVTFSATQDIAVDGWALTLLSKDCLSYASTCQTIGLNTGFFASFTVFLAFNSEAFAHKWGFPQLTLAGYLRFWGIFTYAITAWLIIFKKEDKEPATEADMSIIGVYKQIWAICKLKHIQLLIIVHLFAKIGFAANDAGTSLKLVEKGFKREDLAVVVLIDFPFQIMGGWLAAKWSRGDKPLRPWIIAFWPRMGFAVLAALIVYFFPHPPIPMYFFIIMVVHTIFSSFASTVQFVGISAFHTRISDPLIGGTYMTLLNTFTNMGGTWPKWFVLKGIDLFTVATCQVPKTGVTVKATECVSEHGKAACKHIGGVCHMETDGYYITMGICLGFGVIFLLAFILPTARRLQSLPISVWRVKME